MTTTKSTQHNLNAVSSHHVTTSIRLRFLTPLLVAIVLLIVSITIGLFYFESERQSYSLNNERLTRTQSVTKEFYERNVVNDVRAIKSIMAVLQIDQKLAQIFKAQDRDKLLTYTSELYQQLKGEYHITHFYFSTPERVNLLRVHAPERYGDRIDRLTTLWAEKNRATVHGVELGVLGTFTLRVVTPWYDKQSGKLIGYVELGMEIDHVIQRIRETFNLEALVVVHKEYLQQRKWEEGMKVLGRAEKWDEFEGFVLGSESSAGIPVPVSEYLMSGEYIHLHEVTKLEHDGLFYWLLAVPVADVLGHHVATMILLTDVTSEVNMAQRSSLVIGSIVLLVGILLVIFFYWQTGRVGRRIEQDGKVLQELATSDGLTGLYTRRVFHEYLELEMAHASRFGRAMSLLLLDIDYFKDVNVTYGHQAGDRVLQELSKRIRQAVREIDHVCRYSDVELAIVLPETDEQGALEFAKRLKGIISAYPYNIGRSQSFLITTSIGIASYPLHADTDTTLICAADSALYDAREMGRNRVQLFSKKAEPAL